MSECVMMRYLYCL